MDIISGLSFDESKIYYNKMQKELEKFKEKLNKVVHKNKICNNCFKKDFNSKRFICAECNNDNLSQEWEKYVNLNSINVKNI